MLSILIPTYNYNAFPLAETIEKQALKSGLVFELICIDDGSFSALNIKNQEINTLTNCKFIENIKNIGSYATRKLLAQKAQYNWLLFLDADVTPKHSNFLENYIGVIKKNVKVVFGGFAYYDTKPMDTKILRYTFGKHREQISATKRNKNSYKVIISANFLILKQIFLKINQENENNVYGLDYLFGSLLKSNKIEVTHIDNEVYHLGIDDSILYLKKAKQAVETIYFLYSSDRLESNSISLVKAFKLLNFFGLTNLFGQFMLKFNSKITNNLLGRKPCLFLLDLYKLGCFCRITN